MMNPFSTMHTYRPGLRLSRIGWISLFMAAVLLLAGCSPSAQTATPTPVVKSTLSYQDLIPQAENFVNLMVQGNFDTAVKPFDATMLKAMPADKLNDTWRSLIGQVGDFQSQLGTHTAESQGYQIVFVTCQFAKAVVDIQVVFDSSGQISGLFFKPGQAPAATPQSSSGLMESANTFIDQLAQGEYEAATANFDDQMKADAPASTLEQIWGQVTGQMGAFQQRSAAREAYEQGYQSVYVTCQFANGALDARVTFNDQGQIAGLHFVPPQSAIATPLPYVAPDYVDSASFREIDVTVGSGQWALPGTLTLPNGAGPFAGVVLVHGSGPNDRDETVGSNKPFRDLAWGLASKGIAVLRYEKRTRAHADLFTPEVLASLTLQEETIDDALLAAQLLRQPPVIDPQKIFVLGHSQGALAAPRIGQQDPALAGLILLAGPTIPLEDEILSQVNYLANLDGTLTDPEKNEIQKLETQVVMVKDPALSPDTPSSSLPLGIPAAFWLDLRGYQPAQTAQTLSMPMLVLQGGRDYQVSASKDFEGWKTALAGKDNATLKLYPALNHLFISGEGPSGPDEYMLAGHVDPAVVGDIAQWIQNQ